MSHAKKGGMRIRKGDHSATSWARGEHCRTVSIVRTRRTFKVAVAEDEDRARTGHLKRHLQERYMTRLEALRAVTSEEIVQLLLFGGASGGCTAAAAAAAAGCGASRLE